MHLILTKRATRYSTDYAQPRRSLTFLRIPHPGNPKRLVHRTRPSRAVRCKGISCVILAFCSENRSSGNMLLMC